MAIVFGLIGALSACDARRDRAADTASGDPRRSMASPHTTPMVEAPPATTSCVPWDAPERWKLEPGRAMRLATYRVPAASGDDAAECAIYYFGPGQGGDVRSNFERWAGEFEGGAKLESSRFDAGGMKVDRARAHGTWMPHVDGADPAMPARDFTLLGAIVEGPNGAIFVKLIGPSPVVDAAAPEFDRLLHSFRKTAPTTP